jgi:hypothetical protein
MEREKINRVLSLHPKLIKNGKNIVMKKRIFQLTVLMLLTFSAINAQKKQVHGKIVTFNEFPIENAEISIKKSKTITTTDSFGFFSIESQLKDKITIKARGFKTAMVKVKNYTDSINVNLVFGGDEKDIKLAKGYGHIAKKNLTYAITHLAAENNDHVNYTNIV